MFPIKRQPIGLKKAPQTPQTPVPITMNLDDPICVPLAATVIPVLANGQYHFYKVPQNKLIRLINIGGEIQVGTFNLDSFIIWPGSNNHAVYLDSTLNRGTPFDIPLGDQNLWLRQDWELAFQVTNWTVAGTVTVRQFHEVKQVTYI